MPCTARRAASPYLQIPSLGVGAPIKKRMLSGFLVSALKDV